MDEDGAENELVYPDDDLTWGDLADASGVGDPLVYTRAASRNVSSASGSQARRVSSATITTTLRRNARMPMPEVEEEEEFVDDQETDEEEFEEELDEDDAMDEDDMPVNENDDFDD